MTRRRVPACGSPALTLTLSVALFAALVPVAVGVGLWQALRRPEARPGDTTEGGR